MTSDEMRERLMAALTSTTLDPGFYVDTLLPTVRALIADELRAAAEELHLNISGRQGLLDCADALDPR